MSAHALLACKSMGGLGHGEHACLKEKEMLQRVRMLLDTVRIGRVIGYVGFVFTTAERIKMSAKTILDNALANFGRASALLGDQYSDDLMQKLLVPKERIEVALGPQLDDGKIHIFKAFIVRHSQALGPSKGGIRMTPTVTLDDVAGLAMEMAWKCALIGVPFGGGKAGIVADPESLSKHNKETLIRSFVHNSHRHIGPQVYVPAPDMGTNEADMGYVKDTLAFSAGQATTDGCFVTGKPVILGGIPGRREATGRGVAICVQEALKVKGIDPARTTAIVQGFGNVGSVAAKVLSESGVKIVGVSDIHGAIYSSGGLDVGELLTHAASNGRVSGFAAAEDIDGRELLEMPCDILVPAAAQSQITDENAGRIQAKLIAEGANSPTTPDADVILEERKIEIIPDILCNAGGVFVSYLEFAQETQQDQMTVEEVNERLSKRMIDRFTQVYQLSTERELSMRDAAMYLALRTVCEALTARGYLQ